MTDTVYRFMVKQKNNNDAKRELARQARSLGFGGIDAVCEMPLYFVRGTLAPGEQELLGRFLFCDELTEYAVSGENESAECAAHIETALKPGVSDPSSREALRAVRELGIQGIRGITRGKAFDIYGSISESEALKLAAALFYNTVIEYAALGAVTPHWPGTACLDAQRSVETFDIAAMDDDALLAFSKERRAALDIHEMRAVRAYYAKKKRAATDAEFETIAQTWSEHCVHKTFKAKIQLKEGSKNYACYPSGCVDNVLKTYIKKATDEIAAPWVLSSFVDNAGIIDYDEKHAVSFKVETHNHPSAIEPFGGANTGVGGVIRDVMGVSARPIAVTDVLCFGFPDTPPDEVPKGSLHPKRIIAGVIDGVEDYGNKMGIPTVNGGVHFDKAYATNPLVYCGCAGIAPKASHKTSPQAGDHAVVIGGKTGRDGLRGATFSSMVMDAATGEAAGSSVQIGEPIIQKCALEVLLEARDAGLYSAVTDCGAGGLSSAVGEMASKLGADVDIAGVILKYAGLAPWEIWLSEAQERMVLAVPEKNMPALRALCKARDVDCTDLGILTGDGVLRVRFEAQTIIELDCDFLHAGPPQRVLGAASPKESCGYKLCTHIPQPTEALKAVLAHHAVCSREPVVRRYDHEVQGASVLRSYDSSREYDVGAMGPQDAAVIRPRETIDARGIAVANGFNPRYARLAPYAMAAAAIDEAVRSAVAVGADPSRIAILDNFCMGDPERPETLWALIESARACYETACALRTPFISGKDSFNNEYITSDGTRASIPPSLLISAIGLVPDIARVPGSDVKRAGGALYLVGKPEFSFGGSVFADLFGLPAGKALPPAWNKAAAALYAALHTAIRSGCVASCHDISDGGLLAACAEMCIGGGRGASISVSELIEKRALDMGDIRTAECTALFAETTGCFIVEAAFGKEAELESICGSDCLIRIGSVNEQAALTLSDSSYGTLNISVRELAAAFTSGGSLFKPVEYAQ